MCTHAVNAQPRFTPAIRLVMLAGLRGLFLRVADISLLPSVH